MSRHILQAALLLALVLNACVPAGPSSPPDTSAEWSAPTVPALIPTAADPVAGPTATTGPAPVVTAHQPVRTLVRDLQPATSLTFNHSMDRESVAGALSVSPGVPFTLHWEANTVSVDWLEALEPGETYRIQIDRSATGTNGVQLSKAYGWKFEVAGVLAALKGPTTQNPQGQVRLTFNYPMNPASVEAAYVMAPSLSGTWLWNDEHTVATYAFLEPYTFGTTYRVTFEKELRDMAGRVLPEPASRTVVTPSAVISAMPVGEYVAPASSIQVRFAQPMEAASTEAAFTITPAVPGTFQWQGELLTFTPERGRLDSETRYTVTIAPTARTAAGRTVLASAYVWSFQTGLREHAATFGFGPNVQVVGAGGRRAVQFVALQPASLITVELHQLSVAQFLDRYSSSFRGVAPGEERSISIEGAPLAASWTVQTPGSGADYYGRSLQEIVIPADVPPGMYVANIGAGDVDDQLIIALTHYTVVVKQAERQMVTWVTDVAGAPAADVPVGIYARDGVLIAEGRSDQAGVFRAEVDRDPQPLIVIAGQAGDYTASGLTDEWRNRGYAGDWWRPAPAAQNYAAYIYTDRPIYRPGQTVNFKAILRRDDDAILSVLPDGSAVTVRIRDARNNVVRTQQLASNGFGTVHGEFTVADGAMLGDYAVEVMVEGEIHRQVFKVQDYRKPDYEVTVQADAPGYVAGDTVRVTVDTRYFFGEPVANARVTIRQYELGSDYGCWDDCHLLETWFDIGREGITGVTDDQGRFVTTLAARLGSYDRSWSWNSTLRQSTFSLEATVDDGSHQAVSSFATIKVFSAAETLRLSAGGYFKSSGEPFDVQASVRSIFDQPVDGRRLELSVQQWQSGQNDYLDVLPPTRLTTDAAGLAAAPLTITRPGHYRLRLTGRDQLDNVIEYDSGVYVFGGSERWVGESSDLRLAVDRDSYAPGETARLLIESAFDGPALLTFERGTTRRQQLVQLTAPLTQVDAPILAADAPNIFVTVNAWQAQDTSLDAFEIDDWGYWETTRADSRLLTATVELKVPVTDKTLTVTLTPDRAVYAPREPATFTVRVTNARGEPVSAEVSLALVDEAIFSLSDDLSGPMFDRFYFDRANIVRTYNTMAPYRWLPCECGGGGGGGGGFGPGNPRSHFPDTAAWMPVLHTDWNGEATITFDLPDTLTSWRLTAKAVTADTQVGDAFVNVITRQPVVIRPLLPRTLTEGDQVELSAVVRNDTGTRQQVLAAIDAGDRVRLAGPATQTLTLAAGAQRIVGWTATAMRAGEAALTFSAQLQPAAGASAEASTGDAVRLTLPIQPLAVPDVTTQIGEFTGQFDTVVAIPAGASELSSVRVDLSRSIAGTLLNGLEFLTGYPYGCVEQTMSRALPNAVVGRAFHQLGMAGPTLQADLPPKIEASVQRLYGFQHNDGGWGWWFDDESDVYQTAWVVFGLSVTGQAGYEVDSGVIRRGVDWLTKALETTDERTRAFALYSMAYAGYGDLDATQALAQRAGRLDAFSQAALALALHRLGAEDDARRLLDSLEASAVVSGGRVSWPGSTDDGHYDRKTMASTTRSTALVLSAFSQIEPGHRLESGMVAYLMSQRKEYGWGSTNETSFAILGLTDHLLAREDATADTAYTVEVGGTVVAEGVLGRGSPAAVVTVPFSQLKEGQNPLRITQSGGGQLYYTLTSRVLLPQAGVEAAGSVIVGREYFDAETNKPITGPITAGRLVKVVLTVVMPDEGYYMLIEDKLPGGLEALNEGLNTSSHDGQVIEGYSHSPYRWQGLGYNNKEVRGDRVSFFITELAAGRRTLTYYARAVRSGTFVAMPAEASAMYDVTVWGRSASSRLLITER